MLHCCLISEPALIAKSNIILDVKPWDDETDMKEVEAQVRKIEADGLLWGAGKFFASHVSLNYANTMFCITQPNWCHWPMESRNYRFPLLLKMTRFLLTGLWKLSRKLKTWSRVLILLLSTRSKLNLHYSCVASVPVWMQQIKTRYERVQSHGSLMPDFIILNGFLIMNILEVILSMLD